VTCGSGFNEAVELTPILGMSSARQLGDQRYSAPLDAVASDPVLPTSGPSCGCPVCRLIRHVPTVAARVGGQVVQNDKTEIINVYIVDPTDTEFHEPSRPGESRDSSAIPGANLS
jgi:hypothetical protein